MEPRYLPLRVKKETTNIYSSGNRNKALSATSSPLGVYSTFPDIVNRVLNKWAGIPVTSGGCIQINIYCS